MRIRKNGQKLKVEVLPRMTVLLLPIFMYSNNICAYSCQNISIGIRSMGENEVPEPSKANHPKASKKMT
jgi:hypothetical protein